MPKPTSHEQICGDCNGDGYYEVDCDICQADGYIVVCDKCDYLVEDCICPEEIDNEDHNSF